MVLGSNPVAPTNLIISKSWKKNTRGGFQCSYKPIILIDSVYAKDEDIYSKVFSEKYYFIRNNRNR